ncbi:MAG: 2-amino-4-hydroxy-6-hydroxymethyldihydropteridine diphosphokinase, partial [Miltoncostaeaceae bacterium]
MRYWLGLGSNLGDRGAALQAMLDRLAEGGVAVEAVSPVYETSPQELDDQPEFLNAAARVRSDLAHEEMLR